MRICSGTAADGAIEESVRGMLEGEKNLVVEDDDIIDIMDVGVFISEDIGSVVIVEYWASAICQYPADYRASLPPPFPTAKKGDWVFRLREAVLTGHKEIFCWKRKGRPTTCLLDIRNFSKEDSGCRIASKKGGLDRTASRFEDWIADAPSIARTVK
jgi:hypothetical protein